MVTRSPKYAHTDPIFVNIDILNLSSFLKFKNCKFIHRDFYKNKNFNLKPRSLAHGF